MKFRRRRSPDAAIDLTPLIDVVFLLLIFFMVTTTFVREGGITLELPEADTDVVSTPAEPVQIVVSVQGTYTVNGEPLADQAVATLMRAIRGAAGDDTEVPMVISADARAPHESVVRVMDAAGRLGFERVRIATQPSSAAADSDS